MALHNIPIWKEAPFIRLIIPLATGISMQWHINLPVTIYLVLTPVCLLTLILFSYVKSSKQFRYYWVNGLSITLLLITLGGALTYCKDFRHFTNCITRQNHANAFAVSLAEPVSEKENSFKALAVVRYTWQNDSIMPVKGRIIIYFEKDSSLNDLKYNSGLVFSKRLQPIQNSGNPGAFDYQHYCAFQQIYYQVYLKRSEYRLLRISDGNTFTGWLHATAKKIVTILRTYIPGDKEAGLAEALLIGYKEHLDKNLVQSYSNTGVVHIIAISGLHLGLIYWLLNSILVPLKSQRGMQWLKAILVISGLWLFGLLAGGSASVCRSAVMFTFIVLGENIGRRTNVYNSLAASAFLLLCYNPFWLWDAGFQLSYVAVLSIVIFMKPFYNALFIQNRLLDLTWKMTAITLAAQILTTPLSIFHFHQFPNYFLLTNLVAVPLSSIIVLAEVTLCAISFSTRLSVPAGESISMLIRLMNNFIEHMTKMPFAVTGQLQLSSVQLALMYLVIAGTCIWIINKNKSAFIATLMCICTIFAVKCHDILQCKSQQKLIVYNVPRHHAIDLIIGQKCLFIADSTLYNNLPLQNFHLKPSRILHRVNTTSNGITVRHTLNWLSIGNKHILIIDTPFNMHPESARRTADLVIISGNPDLTINDLRQLVSCQILVFDSSNAAWNVRKWKAECEKAGISCYSVAEKGAFILNLN